VYTRAIGGLDVAGDSLANAARCSFRTGKIVS
jgi:hypothetical protein